MIIETIKETAQKRVEMFGAKVSENNFDYECRKALQEASDYCNLSGVEYFPRDAEIFLVEYVAAVYLLAQNYSPRYEDMKKDAKTSLTRFRRLRWD